MSSEVKNVTQCYTLYILTETTQLDPVDYQLLIPDDLFKRLSSWMVPLSCNTVAKSFSRYSSKWFIPTDQYRDCSYILMWYFCSSVLVKCFLDAIAAHRAYTGAAVTGQGIDRHLLGMFAIHVPTVYVCYLLWIWETTFLWVPLELSIFTVRLNILPFQPPRLPVFSCRQSCLCYNLDCRLKHAK